MPATLDEKAAQALADALRDPAVPITVTSVDSKPYTRRPAAPFTTSTLQQEAARKLRFSARQTMSVAQSLYENGYITYMRTDSPTLSQQAITAARTQATALYGAETVPDAPARLRRQEQERAGGPRGDPPVRRHLPHAGRARSRCSAATTGSSTT